MATRSPKKGSPKISRDPSVSFRAHHGPHHHLNGLLVPLHPLWSRGDFHGPPLQSPPCHLVLFMHPCPSCIVPPWSPVTPPSIQVPSMVPWSPLWSTTVPQVPSTIPWSPPRVSHHPPCPHRGPLQKSWIPPCPLVPSMCPSPVYVPVSPLQSLGPLCVLVSPLRSPPRPRHVTHKSPVVPSVLSHPSCSLPVLSTSPPRGCPLTIWPCLAIFLMSTMIFFSCASSFWRSRSSSRMARASARWFCRNNSSGVFRRPNSRSMVAAAPGETDRGTWDIGDMDGAQMGGHGHGGTRKWGTQGHGYGGYGGHGWDMGT